MLKLSSVAAVLVLSLASSAQAYGAAPITTVTKAEVTQTRTAQACVPTISPQMAAAMSLPLLTPGCANR